MCTCVAVSQTGYCVYRWTADVNACACSCRHVSYCVHVKHKQLSCKCACLHSKHECYCILYIKHKKTSCPKKPKTKERKRFHQPNSPVAFTL